MGFYDAMQVCLNGHQITSSYYRNPEFRSDHCDKCGAKTIFKCPKCNEPIRGKYHVEGVANLLPTPIPEFCHKCGEPYPWKGKVKEETQDKDTKEPNPLEKIKFLCSRFHLVVNQLKIRHEDRSTLEIIDEYDVQDLLHSLLKIYFDDIRPEEWTPSYAGKTARMDFLLKNEQIVIEVKKTRKGLGEKEVGDQLIIDIARYQKHTDCKKLYCFIYDPEQRIANPQGLENDLTQETEGLKVFVYISPKMS